MSGSSSTCVNHGTRDYGDQARAAAWLVSAVHEDDDDGDGGLDDGVHRAKDEDDDVEQVDSGGN